MPLFSTTQKHFYISSILLITCMLFIIYFCISSLLMLLDVRINSSKSNPSKVYNFLSTYGPNSSFGLILLHLIFFFIHIRKQFYKKNFSFHGFYDSVKNSMSRNFYIGGRIGKGLIILVTWLYRFLDIIAKRHHCEWTSLRKIYRS